MQPGGRQIGTRPGVTAPATPCSAWPCRPRSAPPLFAIALQSLAGFAGHVATTTVHWGLRVAVTATAVCGGLLGARVVDRIRPDRLRRWFGWLIVAMATLVLAQQLHALLWTSREVALSDRLAVARAARW